MFKIEILDTFEAPKISLNAFEEESGTLYQDEVFANKIIVFKRRHELFAMKMIDFDTYRLCSIDGYNCIVKDNPPIEEIIYSFFTNRKYIWRQEEDDE